MTNILRQATQKAKLTKGRKTPRKQPGAFAVLSVAEVDDRLPAELGKALRVGLLAKAAEAAGKIVLDEARGNLAEHRDSGFLQDNLDQVTRQYPKTMYHVVGPISAAYYAYFLEYGTVHQPPYPWFRPAIDQTMGRQKLAMINTITDGAENV